MITNGAFDSLGLDEDEKESFSSLLDERELESGSGKFAKFSRTDVALALQRVDAAGVVGQIAQWRAQDRMGDHLGGPTEFVNDRVILAVCMLLVREHTPLWVTEMRNVLWMRLDDDARSLLGIEHRLNTGDTSRDAKNWYDRAWRSIHRLIDVLDPYPGTPKKLMKWQERQELIKRRAQQQEFITARKVRLNWFSNQMLEMTFQMLPRRIRRAWKGDLSVDQTSLRAPSRIGVPPAGLRDRAAMVMEIDAGWHFKNPALRGGSPTDSRPEEFEWAYEANLFATTSRDPKADVQPHPHMILAFTLSKPSKELGPETLLGLQSIVDRGHPVGRLTGDQAYFDNEKPEKLHNGVEELGYAALTEYRDINLGAKGGHGGAMQLEGSHYCPALGKTLVNATKDLRAGMIDAEVYAARIKERSYFELRAKERPDDRGHVPMMCPAYGPGATIECPLRAINPKSSKKAKPVVLERDLPKKPDRICKNTSVDFGPEDGLRHKNAIPYGSKEFAITYKYDRNVIESMNAFAKDSGKENLGASQNRRLRGMAAQQVLVTMLLVSVNIRKVNQFLRDLIHGKKPSTTLRRRDREGLSPYVRGRKRRSKKATAAQMRLAEEIVALLHLTPPPYRETNGPIRT